MAGYNVLILNSKLINLEMQNEFGQIPPILVPFKGKPLITYLISHYHKAKNIIITVEEKSELIEDYFDFFPDSRVKLSYTESNSLTETVNQTNNSFSYLSDDSCVINFGDTLANNIPDELLLQNFFAYGLSQESERWTLFTYENNRIYKISDKQFTLNTKGWKTFIGVFGITNLDKFINIMNKTIIKHKVRIFYQAVKEYYNNTESKLFYIKNWMDFGHLDNYYKIQESQFRTRYFNKNIINLERNTISKHSDNNEKLINEIKWYISIPDDLKYYTPKIYNYNLSYRKPFIEMEFYSYQSLNESYVYSRYDFDVWNKIIKNLFKIINIETSYSISEPDIKNDLKKMYRNKIINRLDLLIKENSLFKELVNKELILNGRTLPTIEWIKRNIDKTNENFNAYNQTSLNIIHGDLCLSNILFDNKFGIIKLIDPRGSFGKYTIYGDIRYDIAKLSHSFLGFYDFILLNQYKLIETDRNRYTLKIRTDSIHQKIGEIFKHYLKSNGYNLREIRYLESLLFISMIPLHSEDQIRQMALLLNGLQILTELMET